MSRQPVRVTRASRAAASAPATSGLDDSVSDVAPSGAVMDSPDDLSALMSELAGVSSSKVTVYRVERGKPQAYVFSCTPDAFSLDVLRDKYNGGEFRLYISRDGALWKNKSVFVEPKAIADPAAPSDAAALAATIREGFAAQNRAFTEALRVLAAPPPTPSPLAGLNLAELITSIGGLLAALRPPTTASAGLDPASAITLLIKGLELGRDSGSGGGGAEPTMLGLLSDLIKSPMMTAAVQAATTAAPTPQQPRVARAPAPQPPQPPRVQPVAPPINQPAAAGFARETPPDMFSLYLNQLCAKAAEGSDPSLYADLILDNLDEATLNTILALQPNPVDGLIARYPQVAPHRDWFIALLDTMQQALTGGDLTSDDGVLQSGLDDSTLSNATGTESPAVPGGNSLG